MFTFRYLVRSIQILSGSICYHMNWDSEFFARKFFCWFPIFSVYLGTYKLVPQITFLVSSFDLHVVLWGWNCNSQLNYVVICFVIYYWIILLASIFLFVVYTLCFYDMDDASIKNLLVQHCRTRQVCPLCLTLTNVKTVIALWKCV